MNALNALAFGNVAVLAVPAVNTSTLTGTGIDVQVYEGVAAVVLNSAAGTGTDPTMDGKIQHCDTVDGGYADVSGATFAQVLEVASVQILSLDIGACKQFIRIVLTIGGTTPSFTCGAAFVGIKKTST